MIIRPTILATKAKEENPNLKEKIKEQKQNPTHKSQIQNHTKSGIGEGSRI
jgi:hypothetical protein